MLESDRAERSRRILRESLAAMGVVFFCLTGGILTYLFVNGGGGSSDIVIEESVPAAPAARVDPGLGRG
jgi:hypothetical protein